MNLLLPLLGAFGSTLGSPQLKLLGPVPGQPYVRYATIDPLGRKIVFYVSEDGSDRRLPLVLYIQGSGVASHFAPQGAHVRPQGGHPVVEEAFRGWARTLIVEKPGVEYLDVDHGDPETQARPEFHREHALDRWSVAIIAAENAARKMPKIAARPCVVIGHSEGGHVAARVARIDSRVSHVAILAGGGPSALFDFAGLARRGAVFRSAGEEGERRFWDVWRAMRNEPNRTDRFFMGYTYRKWFSFFRTSPIEELTRYRGRVFVGQGGEDAAMMPESADVLVATLRSQGKEVAYERWSHANHSFRLSDDPKADGWHRLMDRIRKWVESRA